MGPENKPRWLDGDEQAIWNAFAYALVRLPAAFDAQMQRDAGINHFDYMVLAALSSAPEHLLRMSDLAHCTASSLSRLSNVVSRLESRGWVRRDADPADARCTLAVLTQPGMDKVVESAPAHVAEVRRLVIDPLTRPQLRQLGIISDRILNAIEPRRPSLSDAPVSDSA